MTSTHTGNPVCCAAALANIDVIEKEGLVEKSRQVGDALHARLGSLRQKHPDVIGAIHGRGLVAGVHMVKPGSKEPDGDLAFRITEACIRKGLLMFSPVGFGGATVKISPPLIITEEAVAEGVDVLNEAVAEAKGS
jgi:4-aminobutyrate aminotransferase-like enzyme